MEPVWGGTADTAADVRGTCALGLVATGYPRALVAIAQLLYDAEPDTRVGAIRAAANGAPREAELLLRSKALAGDEEPSDHRRVLKCADVRRAGRFARVRREVACEVGRCASRACRSRPRRIARPGGARSSKECLDGARRRGRIRFALIRAAAAHRSERRFRLAAVDCRRCAAARSPGGSSRRSSLTRTTHDSASACGPCSPLEATRSWSKTSTRVGAAFLDRGRHGWPRELEVTPVVTLR